MNSTRPPLLSIGTLLHHRYRVVRVIAQGGMGVVYETSDEGLFGRRVAVKEILAAPLDVDARRRFSREARLLTEIRHPGIPHVYDHFHSNLSHYLAMEYVDGRTLAETLARLPSTNLEQALRWIRGLAEILHHLHAHSPPIVFRDLKPANVMITDAGEIKLIDFGIAWAASGPGTQGLGTPGYAPPEQYARGDCDPRMDVYGLGATAYRILTGQDPPDSVARAFSGVVLRPVCELNPTVPAALGDFVQRMLDVLPRCRPASIEEVLAELERLTPPPPRPPSALSRATTGTVLIADDDPNVQRLLETLLQAAGFQTIVVSDGASAVETARTSRPDLVVLDVQMPHINGIDACRLIRQDTDVPILMLTGLGGETDRVVGLELGADDYVTKPFSSRELLARVRAMMRRRRE